MLLGGVLTAALGWQFVFFVNVPIGIVVIAMTLALITRDPAGAPQAPLDLPGAVTITGALVALVGALSTLEQPRGAGPLTIALGALAIGLGIAFVIIEQRTTHPLLPLRMLRNRQLLSGNLVVLLVGGAIVALFFALSVYLQDVLGYDPLMAGLSQLPLAGILVVAAGAAPALIARFGIVTTVIASSVTFAGGLVWLSVAPADATFVADLLGPTLLIGAGIGGALVAATQLAVDGVEGGESGLAGGLVNTSQQIGGALGLALLASLAAVRTDAVAAAGAPTEVAVTAGFSWLLLGAAIFSLAAAVIALIVHRRVPPTV